MGLFRRGGGTGDQRRTALHGLTLAGRTGLEIGALDRPLVTPADGGRVFYADHWPTPALRARYAADPAVDPARIVAVDFDLSAVTLTEIGTRTGPLDYVVASHVVEHVPDLAGWLAEIHGLLRPGGVLALVVPDKRFTFDLHRRESVLADVEEAKAEARTRPGLGTVLDYLVNVVPAPDAGALWHDYGLARTYRPLNPPEAVAPVIAQWRDGAYIDAHCWVATPWSFVALIGGIVESHGLDFALRLARPTPRGQLEFYVQLERRAPDTPPTRWARAERRLRRRAGRPERGGFSLT